MRLSLFSVSASSLCRPIAEMSWVSWSNNMHRAALRSAPSEVPFILSNSSCLHSERKIGKLENTYRYMCRWFYSILYIIDLMQKINNPFKENLQKINLFKRVTYFLVHDITNRSPPLFWGSSSSQTLSWSSPPSLSSSWVPLVFPIQGVEFCLLLISPHIVLLTTSDDIFELWWPEENIIL